MNRPLDLNEEDKAKFWSKVSKGKPQECWPWLDKPSDKGYAILRLKRRGKVKASRVSWTIANSEDPGKLQVLHTCDNPLCVNPNHLFLGTSLDNMRDKVSKGRQAKGPTHGKAKSLPEDITQAEKIRTLWRSGDYTQKQLGLMFGYSRRNIGHIVNGDSRNITMEDT